MAFITTRYRMLFKALEIGGSAIFLFLCVKAFCSHFYNDLNLRHMRRDVDGAQIGYPLSCGGVLIEGAADVVDNFLVDPIERDVTRERNVQGGSLKLFN